MRTPELGLLSLLLSLLVGCGEDSTGPGEPVPASGRVTGTILLTTQTHVRTGNAIGPVFVEGEGLGALVRWSIDKEVQAPTGEEAYRRLADITLSRATTADTLFVRVPLTPPSATVTYDALLTLGVPATSACSLDGVLGEARVHYLQADLSITDAAAVTVLDHVGSCRVASRGGNVTVRLVLLADGACIVSTPSGEIAVSVPATTSAHVSLKTSSGGSIQVEGLTLTNVVQTAHELTGMLGAGAGEIQLETGNGNVVLSAL